MVDITEPVITLLRLYENPVDFLNFVREQVSKTLRVLKRCKESKLDTKPNLAFEKLYAYYLKQHPLQNGWASFISAIINDGQFEPDFMILLLLKLHKSMWDVESLKENSKESYLNEFSVAIETESWITFFRLLFQVLFWLNKTYPRFTKNNSVVIETLLHPSKNFDFEAIVGDHETTGVMNTIKVLTKLSNDYENEVDIEEEIKKLKENAQIAAGNSIVKNKNKGSRGFSSDSRNKEKFYDLTGVRDLENVNFEKIKEFEYRTHVYFPRTYTFMLSLANSLSLLLAREFALMGREILSIDCIIISTVFTVFNTDWFFVEEIYPAEFVKYILGMMSLFFTVKIAVDRFYSPRINNTDNSDIMSMQWLRFPTNIEQIDYMEEKAQETLSLMLNTVSSLVLNKDLPGIDKKYKQIATQHEIMKEAFNGQILMGLFGFAAAMLTSKLKYLIGNLFSTRSHKINTGKANINEFVSRYNANYKPDDPNEQITDADIKLIVLLLRNLRDNYGGDAFLEIEYLQSILDGLYHYGAKKSIAFNVFLAGVFLAVLFYEDYLLAAVMDRKPLLDSTTDKTTGKEQGLQAIILDNLKGTANNIIGPVQNLAAATAQYASEKMTQFTPGYGTSLTPTSTANLMLQKYIGTKVTALPTSQENLRMRNIRSLVIGSFTWIFIYLILYLAMGPASSSTLTYNGNVIKFLLGNLPDKNPRTYEIFAKCLMLVITLVLGSLGVSITIPFSNKTLSQINESLTDKVVEHPLVKGFYNTTNIIRLVDLLSNNSYFEQKYKDFYTQGTHVVDDDITVLASLRFVHFCTSLIITAKRLQMANARLQKRKLKINRGEFLLDD